MVSLSRAMCGFCLGAASISSFAFAQTRGWYDIMQDQRLRQSQQQALQAYTDCMRTTPGQCGQPPQATYAPPPQPVYQQPTQCHEYCYQSGPNRYCNTRCY